MAFLDNSGDIILDAVLTDAGRQRMARGNFKITKFALGDEEINYSLFNAEHPSGSAFYDLKIMQTPILEAFTDNASMMKSRLMTMVRNNILYLPILKLNSNADNNTESSRGAGSRGVYHLLADVNTQKDITTGLELDSLNRSMLRGYGTAAVRDDFTNHIAVDQGIDSTDGGITYKDVMPEDLVETAFLIRADNRLLRIHSIDSALNTTTAIPNQFVDDDGIATYYLSLGDGFGAVEQAPSPNRSSAVDDARRRNSVNAGIESLWSDEVAGDDADAINEVFSGPLGSILRFYPKTTIHVQNSDKLFDLVGSTASNQLTISGTDEDPVNINYKFIDTVINVVGVTTGYSIDIPIRIVKKTS